MKRHFIYLLATLTLFLSCNSCFLMRDTYSSGYHHEAPPPPPPPTKKPVRRPVHNMQAPPPPPASHNDSPQDHPHRK